MGNEFDLLDEKIRNILRNDGITEPTEAQRKLIPVALRGSSVLLLSPTGSGKTEAAVLPIFTKIIQDRPDKISALYITPLRALNRDMLSRLIHYATETGIQVSVRHSDISQAERRRILDHPPDLLITTPESLQILLNGRRLKSLISHVRSVIIDEVHELATNERGSQFAVAMERLRAIVGDFQVIGLSATVGNPEDLAQFISPHNPAEIVETSMLKKLDITPIIPLEADERLAEKMGCDFQYAGTVRAVWELIKSHKGTLVFVNTRSTAEDLAFRLRLWLGDVPVLVHHGSLSREVRESAERLFKNGEIKALICTSSLELGIDIGSADLVIQLNSPRQVNKLIQRVGRSGHWIEKTSLGRIICNDVIELEEALAISQLANEAIVEKVRIRKGSLATVANQIMLMLWSMGSSNVNEIFRIVKGAYPFRSITREDFIDVVKFLADTHKIWFEGSTVGKKRGVLKYYIGNISMIPSEKNYRVIDRLNHKFIGTLDEKYVVSEVEPGYYFVMKGNTWRVTSIEEATIYVEPIPTTAIAPKWSGEDIPVLPETTLQVSRHRVTKEISLIDDTHSRETLRKWWDNDLATSDKIVIESSGGEIIIQLLLGTKGNFTIAEVLTGILVSITGESVEMDFSPYHIYLRTSMRLIPDRVFEILKGIDPDRLEQILTEMVRRSRFFNSIFLYEARKFGIISPDVEVTRMRFERIVDSYRDSVLFKDSVHKLISDYMDLKVAKDFLRNVRSGNLTYHGYERLSETSRAFITHYSERVSPLAPTSAILSAIKKRLLNEKVILFCTRCKNIRTERVAEIKSVKCPVCSSYLVASLSEFESQRLREYLRNPDKNRDFGRRIVQNAHLVKERGIEAVMALAAHGIGPGTASRLLQVTYLSEEDFIKAILRAEIDYAKSRRFWD